MTLLLTDGGVRRVEGMGVGVVTLGAGLTNQIFFVFNFHALGLSDAEGCVLVLEQFQFSDGAAA